MRPGGVSPVPLRRDASETSTNRGNALGRGESSPQLEMGTAPALVFEPFPYLELALVALIYSHTTKKNLSKLKNSGAVYRWVVKNLKGKKEYYFGQTNNLRKRVKFFLKNNQRTNSRLREIFKKKREIILYDLVLKPKKVSNKVVQPPFEEKYFRLLLESMLIADAKRRKYIIHNLD